MPLNLCTCGLRINLHEHKNIYYLKEGGTFHSSILREQQKQWDSIIKVPHRLLIVLYSNLQKWVWGPWCYILKQNHRKKGPFRCSWLYLWDLVKNKVSSSTSWYRDNDRKIMQSDIMYLEGPTSSKTKCILIELNHKSI